MDHLFKKPSLEDRTNSGKQLFVCVRPGCGFSDPAPTRFDLCHGEPDQQEGSVKRSDDDSEGQ